MRRVFCLLAMLWLCFPVSASAQEKPPATLVAPTSGPRLEFLDEVSFYEQRYIRLADAIPEDKYGWRPGEGVRSTSEVRSIGEVYAHVASANYTFAKMLGTPTPTNVDLKVLATSAGDKAKDIQALKDSFVHFRNAILAIKDSDLDKEIKGPRGQTTIRGSFFLITGHFGEHLGQSIAYARSVGIVPPWTLERPRQDADKPPKAATQLRQPMERVNGIGGVFFRARDPKALSAWYLKNLGINPVPESYDQSPWEQQAGPTAFAPFPEDTKYFGSADRQWMVNFRVANLDEIVQQLKNAGIDVKVDPEKYPNGRFARLHDLEGNPIELWEPANPAPK